jgi:hypothetical protein
MGGSIGDGGALKTEREELPMTRKWIAAGVAAVAALALAAPTYAGGRTTTCTDVLAPGTYQRVVVPAGATCLSEGPVRIRSGVYVRSGATFVLGSEENPMHTGTITGGVHARNAASVQIHFSTISGGISIRGGSGPFGGPFGVTWNTIEDSVVNGAVTIVGYDGFWQGFFRNNVKGSVNFNGNTLVDPDGNELQTNTIHGSLNCSGNDPAPQQGDSEGSPNSVTGAETGQCVGI